MIVRCTSPTHESAKNYFHRGIKVCDDWKTFVGFQSWALANGYRLGLSIERKESAGNYEPDNCEWITLAENGRRASVARKAREDWMVREILRLTKRVEELERHLA
jgi:hypothetical protein